ncbi:hypothetical protein SO802_026413 [Lithocarpus litseifolius]|uniref:Retrotransposon gag domain-containing protein n=1 Tax=Lithocarpus litseifolius TaxID=425828 RepID=A0AAW2C1Q0_9ROSI
MSTSGPSLIKETTHEIALLKEQMTEIMRMIQQLVVGGNRGSSGPILEGSVPHSENENWPPIEPNQDQTTPLFTPQRNNQEVDPPKDKTSKSSYGEVKSQVETEKICIIEGSDARGSVNLDSLTNFPQVIMPPRFKAPEFVNWKEMANAFLKYYRFKTKITPDCMVLQRTEKKSKESFREYAQRWCKLATQVLPPMMKDEMIKWFIDNFKPPYYEKMISAQLTHFASLFLIGEHIDEGIRSKKIVIPEALNSMIEQQVKKETSHKEKEADVHVINKALEGPKGVNFAYIAPNARPYQQQV